MSRSDILLICSDQLESRLLTTALIQTDLVVHVVSSLEDVTVTPKTKLIILANHDNHDQQYHTAVRELRVRFETPLLLLTDYQSEADHLQVLQEGVDLILFRPYSIRFLAAQIPALLRRLWPSADSNPIQTPPTEQLGSDDIQLDSNTHMLHFRHNSPLRLSRLEFRLLHKLMLHPRQVIPTEMLVEHVWGYDGEGDGEQMRKLVCRLRSKLKDNGREPHFIHTIPNVGYSFRDAGDHYQGAHAFA